MITVDVGAARPVDGNEGTKITQIFHPHNTMLGIRYSMVKCALEPGGSSAQHVLKSSEVYYILQGEGVLQVDGEDVKLSAGHAVYVPPHSKQHIRNSGAAPLEFLCIVDPAWRREDEMVLK
jgi:mannose-6-phosphate isomerase-like protein (cupin superfamily)